MKTIFYSGILVIVSTMSLVNVANAQGSVPDQQEFTALKALYDSLGGSSWTTKTNWPVAGSWPSSATAAQMSTWYGITVTNGDVTSVSFATNNLIGKIPSAVGGLTMVNTLSITGNPGVAGHIPSALGSMTALKTIYIFGCSLTGTIPASLFSLPQLGVLWLNSNKLTGSIPRAIGDATALTNLNLSTNQLTGPLPNELSNCHGLATLNVSLNQLSTLEPLGAMPALSAFRINNNSFTGAIPVWVGQMPAMQDLSLGNNKFSGNLPSSLSSLQSLTNFSFGNNQITGPLPDATNFKNMLTFDVSNNKMSGTIPLTYTNLSKCTSFNINTNQFTGVLPDNLFASWTKVNTINVLGNHFSGSFPSSVGSCTLLVSLCGTTNSFTSLPASILSLSALRALQFENNQLTAIPNLANHPNKANLSITIRTNHLDFSQLEPLIGSGLPAFSYSPQTISDVTSITYQANDTLKIPARPFGTSSTITWQKQQANGTWATINSSNNDPSQKTFRQNSAAISNEGTYQWIMTNTIVTGLSSLSSSPITVATTTQVAMNKWAFQYQYDTRRRVTAKRVPGADWVYMVYDARDRLVLTQDGNQRLSNQWIFTKYDALNRPVSTGIYSPGSAISQAAMQANVNSYYNSISTNGGNLYETYIGTGNTHGYDDKSFPPVTDASQYLTVTYYDNYSFLNNDNEYAYVAIDAPSQLVGGVTYNQPTANNSTVTGKVTGSKVKVLGADLYWLQSVNYYDDKYRVIQTISDHQRNGQQRTTNIYDFVGKVLATKTSDMKRVTWTDMVNVSVLGNKLVANGGVCSNAGAVSVEQIPSPSAPSTLGNGWVEVTVSEIDPNSKREIGLSSTDANASYTSINYGWFIQGSSAAVFENGSQSTSVTIVQGDILRVERVGITSTNSVGTIVYKKNGVLVRTSTIPSSTMLMADNSFCGTNGTLLNVRTSIATVTETITRTFDYDHVGRLVHTWHSVNGAAAILLAANEYNEIGQIVTKKLHSTNSGSTFKQNVDQRYNIRGWLTNINNSQLASDGGTTNGDNNDLFGMDLLYDQSDTGMGNTSLYNGNISAVKWSNSLALSSAKSSGYKYSYDAMNRILGASYLTNNSSTWTNPTNAFSESGYTYDLNGNIKHLKRLDANGSLLDSLNYSYGTQGNQLQSVTDDGGDALNGFVDGNIGNTDYSYDPAGNMIADKNKNITSITYNYLNLPQQVTKGTGENIKYTYDASGRKLKQQVYSASNALTKTTDYDGELIYQGTALGDTLKFINHEEGRVVMTGATPEYQYHLKDHLGNVRTTFTTQRTVDNPIATFEVANYNTEQSLFLRYDDARVINSTLFDHTYYHQTPPVAGAFSERLSGSANEKTGIARSISVMRGDTINLTVYAKYVDPTNSNNTAALTQFLAQVVAGTASAGTVIDGANYSVNGITPFPYTGLAGEGRSTGTGPKAYLNYLVFDRNFVFMNGGYVQVSTSAKEDGTNVPHQQLSAQVVINQPGYVYTYLSNEAASPIEVYFDDFTVQQIKSPVIATNDYYPFGAVTQSYQRENSVPNNYLYQHKEYQSDLGLNLYDFNARQYDPWAVLTTTHDPHAEKYYSMSPYSWAGGNPMKYLDPTGKDIIILYQDDKGKTQQYNYKNGSTYKGSNQFIKNFYSAVGLLNSKGAGGIISALEKNSQKVFIQQKSGISNQSKNTINWDPHLGLVTKNATLSPTSVLNHEADHELQYVTNHEQWKKDATTPDKDYDTKEERRVITGSEQDTAKKLGEVDKGKVTRTDHNGTLYPTLGPTSTQGKDEITVESKKGNDE